MRVKWGGEGKFHIVHIFLVAYENYDKLRKGKGKKGRKNMYSSWFIKDRLKITPTNRSIIQ